MKKKMKKGSASSKKEFIGKKKSGSKSIFAELDEATKKSYDSKDSFGEQADYFKKGVKIKRKNAGLKNRPSSRPSLMRVVIAFLFSSLLLVLKFNPAEE